MIAHEKVVTMLLHSTVVAEMKGEFAVARCPPLRGVEAWRCGV